MKAIEVGFLRNEKTLVTHFSIHGKRGVPLFLQKRNKEKDRDKRKREGKTSEVMKKVMKKSP